MNRDFDVFVKEHLQEILCLAEKEHSLALIKRTSDYHQKREHSKHRHHAHGTSPLVQDCAISPSFSDSHA